MSVTEQAESVVLIGSGPSLNRIDVRALAPFHTIAFNRSWLAWPSWTFTPTYHACLDPLSMAIIGRELPPVVRSNPATRFFLHGDAARYGVGGTDRVSLSELAPGDTFASSLPQLTDFGNVGAISLQVLALLGYRKVLMVGVDGSYGADPEAARDPNHFRDDYARGRKPLTDADRVRYTAGWPLAAAECQRLGIDVRNASPGSALSCFPAVGLADGLAWLAAGSVACASL